MKRASVLGSLALAVALVSLIAGGVVAAPDDPYISGSTCVGAKNATGEAFVCSFWGGYMACVGSFVAVVRYIPRPVPCPKIDWKRTAMDPVLYSCDGYPNWGNRTAVRFKCDFTSSVAMCDGNVVVRQRYKPPTKRCRKSRKPSV